MMPKKKRYNTAIRFPPELHAALVEAADDRDLSINFLVNAAVREFMNRLLPADEIRFTRTKENEQQT